MITTEDIQRLVGRDVPVVGEDGDRIGTMGEVYLDVVTGEPAWVTVHTGLFGRAESYVPLLGAVPRGDEIHVPYAKDAVKHSPRPGSTDGRLSPDEERELYRHYGLLHDDGTADDDHGDRADDDRRTSLRYPGPVPSAEPVPPRGDIAAAGPVPDELAATAAGVLAADGAAGDRAAAEGAVGHPDDGSMVRSEEHLRVIGTERVPTERVRLRRYTVTEQRTMTVPVTREEVRLEYEPAAPGAQGEVVADEDIRDPGPRDARQDASRDAGEPPRGADGR